MDAPPPAPPVPAPSRQREGSRRGLLLPLLSGFVGGVLGAALVLGLFFLLAPRGDLDGRLGGPLPTATVARPPGMAPANPPPIAAPTAPPTPTLRGVEVTATAVQLRQVSTQAAGDESACRRIEEIYGQRGQVFNRWQDPELTVVEVLGFYGLSPTSLNSVTRNLEARTRADAQRCQGG